MFVYLRREDLWGSPKAARPLRGTPVPYPRCEAARVVPDAAWSESLQLVGGDRSSRGEGGEEPCPQGERWATTEAEADASCIVVYVFLPQSSSCPWELPPYSEAFGGTVLPCVSQDVPVPGGDASAPIESEVEPDYDEADGAIIPLPNGDDTGGSGVRGSSSDEKDRPSPHEAMSLQTTAVDERTDVDVDALKEAYRQEVSKFMSQVVQ